MHADDSIAARDPHIVRVYLTDGSMVEGSVRYLEYDWVASPGGLILEVPGESHTLVSDHPEGTKLFGWMQGPIEFYDGDGKFIDTIDVWWFINHYEEGCRALGVPVNKQLYL